MLSIHAQHKKILVINKTIVNKQTPTIVVLSLDIVLTGHNLLDGFSFIYIETHMMLLYKFYGIHMYTQSLPQQLLAHIFDFI